MSIEGINGPQGNWPVAPSPHRPAGPDDARSMETRAPASRADEISLSRRSRGVVPTDAPKGTDPALWSVLTSEERSFFAKARAMGPLTYGPGQDRGAAAGTLLGGRLDVRV